MFKRLVNRVGPVTSAMLVLDIIGSALAFAFSDAGPFIAFTGGGLTIVAGLVETSWRMQRKIQRDVQELLATLGGIKPGDMPNEFTGELAQFVQDEMRRALRRMLEPDRLFTSAAAFFGFAKERLDRCERGAVVRVLCTERAPAYSQSLPIRRWVAANFAAVRRGVAFIRILVTRRPDTMSVLAAHQADNGLTVFVLRQSELDRMALGRMPADFGMAVLSPREVLFHWGSDEHFRGYYINHPILAAVVGEIMDTLQLHAEPVQPNRAA